MKGKEESIYDIMDEIDSTDDQGLVKEWNKIAKPYLKQLDKLSKIAKTHKLNPKDYCPWVKKYQELLDKWNEFMKDYPEAGFYRNGTWYPRKWFKDATNNILNEIYKFP